MKLTHFALTGLLLLLAAGMYLTMKTDMDGRMEEMKADADRKYELLQKAIKEGQQQQAATAAAPMVAEIKDSVKGRLDAVTGNSAASPSASAGKTASNPSAASVPGKVPAALDPAVAEALNNVKETVNSQPPVNSQANAPDNTAASLIADAPPELGSGATKELLEKEQDVLNNSGIGVDRIAEEAAAAAGSVPEGVRMTKLQSMVLAQPAIARIKENKEAAGFVVLDRGLDANLGKGDTYAVRRGTAIIGRVILTDTIRENESVADVDPSKLVTGMALQKGDELIKFDR